MTRNFASATRSSTSPSGRGARLNRALASLLILASAVGAQSGAYAAPATPKAAKASATTSASLSALPSGIKPAAANLTMDPSDPYAPTTATPDYFGSADPVSGYATGNFANSPLPTSVLIQGSGVGAMYIAEYYPIGDPSGNGGKIKKFDMVNPGSGYQANTRVSVIGGGGVGGQGGPITIDPATGGITAIGVANPGTGYGSARGLRKFTQDLPDLATATPTSTPAVKAYGDPHFIPASQSYEIAAVRTKWQFSTDLGMTTVNLYAQVDSTYSGSACPNGEINWKYPNGNYITNGANNRVCFIPTNTDPTTKTLAPFSYLGPTIVANRGVPVRVTYDNYLPSGTLACTVAGGTALTGANANTCGGDLFLPVDPSVMGAGAGPNGGFYSTNRSTIHLHGGTTPWISDGTMDQWVSPASSNEQYPAGVSTRYVPDMWYAANGTSINACYGYVNCFTSDATPTSYVGSDSNSAPTGFHQDLQNAATYPSTNPGNGRMTFYYTNQDSARLMFYHDHTDGITRLNVYSGLVAGYLLHDSQEGALLAAAGVRTSAAPNTPTAQEKTLVIQDKTFVPAPSQLAIQDPTWNTAAWGGMGNLWFPHVYEPNQNPGLTPANSTSPGASPTGRWDYGPWFWPAVNSTMPPVANPLCKGGVLNTPTCPLGQNTTNPGVPNVSQTPEAFNDSMTVNGVSYPVMHTARKVYLLHLLNGSDDRSLNLNLYYAKSDASNTFSPHCSGPLWTNPLTDTTPACGDAGEVSMVPAVAGSPATQGLVFPDQLQNHTGNVVPDMRLAGPSLVQLSSEGGILPDAAVFPSTPIGFEFSLQSITVTNVKEHSLILGPAQRADVLVDLTNVPAGSTLILYNDAPAPFPGFDPRFDYFTGNWDQTASGGSTTTIPGYAPNTRTIMQIQVDKDPTGTPGTSIFQPGTQLVTQAITDALHADYKASQEAPVVAQIAYNSALGTSTTANQYPNLPDTTTTVTSTGVSSISVNPATLNPAETALPQVLVGGQIDVVNGTASSAGNGNGARGVATISPSDGVGSVSTPTASSYTNAPPITSITPLPTGPNARTAVVQTEMAGANNISSITVGANSGYTSTPGVTISGASTVPAVATAVLAPTSIASLTVNNGGIFTKTPHVTITGTTASNDTQLATAVLTAAPLLGINVISGGLYSSAPTLTISGSATGTHAFATAFLSTSVQSVTVTTPGVCTVSAGSYDPNVAYFAVTLTGGRAAGALTATTAIAMANASVSGSSISLQSIDIVFGGTNYTAAPVVTITPVGMTCASAPVATAQLTPAPIAGVILDQANLGSFTGDPVITLSGTGRGSLDPVLQPTSIAAITLGTPVTDFTGTPNVTFDIASNASVTVALTPTSVAAVTIATGTGLGYTATPVVTIEAPTTGTAATATAVMSVGALQFVVVDPGAGYLAGTTYTANLADGSHAAVTLGTGQVTSITVTNPGSGYLAAPAVALLYPDGTLDTTSATASIASQTVTLNYHPTGIQELFDTMYGRMNAIMSSEVPSTNWVNQTTLPWASVDPPTEIVNTNQPNELVAAGGQPVDSLPDGTQIWRFTHNGVDTHFIHFHMFNVQIIAILGWDGINQPLPAYDLGWRDTVQMDQLTVIYLAIKPIVPIVPWQLPNSIRPLSPSDTLFASDGISPITTQNMNMSTFDPTNTGVTIANQLVNFGWEYMFHCHILGHEEGDMMRPIPVGVVLTAPTAVQDSTTSYVAASGSVAAHVNVSFVDNSINETGFILQRRASVNAAWVTVAAANQAAPTWDNIHQTVVDHGLSYGYTTSITDTSAVTAATRYMYRVLAVDTIGTVNLGAFPSSTVQSDPSNVVYVQIP
jgi:FtsP/CotA-like multicopper oxidase with cupredoxin domain